MILLIAIIIAVSLFIIPTSLNKSGTAISQIKSSILDTNFIQDRDIARRIAIWKFTGMMIKDHPILGSGIGTYKYNTLRYQAEFFEQGDNRSITLTALLIKPTTNTCSSGQNWEQSVLPYSSGS
ncbi:hypothetical protein ES708_02777 [subsurface metagenome]